MSTYPKRDDPTEGEGLRSGMRSWLNTSSMESLIGRNASELDPNGAGRDWLAEIENRIRERWQRLRILGSCERQHLSEHASYMLSDALQWLNEVPSCSIEAVVTDPPYSLVEYDDTNHAKLRCGRGGVWRIPPSFDGARRQPVPRFTVVSRQELGQLQTYFEALGRAFLRALVPGGHVFFASNPLVSTSSFFALQRSGLEKRGEIIRLVQTLRGGDRPKGAEDEFVDVSVMPRSCWEPWGIFRKPITGTVAQNLRKWGTGGLRRISDAEPFKDVIKCSPTRGHEKAIAPHPSLKPQRFLRKVVRAALPLGRGIVLDPFAGSASTLAAAEAVGVYALGLDRDADYYTMSGGAFAKLAQFPA